MSRPAFEPTDEQRRQAETLAGLGLTQDQIALIVGCDPKTLRKYFDHELKVGDAKATEKVAKSLFNRATSGEGRDAVSAAIFWMKARAKWSERHEPERNADDASSVAHRYVVAPPQSESMEEWTKEAERARQNQAPSGLPSQAPKPSS